MAVFILVSSLEVICKLYLQNILLNLSILSFIFWSFMAEAQKDRASESSPTNAIPADLGAILEAQKNAILSAVNSQIHNLQSNLLSAQADLSTQIVSEIQPDTYAFKKKGNEQQFNFNRKVIQKSSSALKALEGPNIAKAKEELSEGISLLNNRQKIIKLADKSEFGWATVQEYIDDELADDEADASKIKKAEKRAAARIKSLQDKKRKTVAKSSTSTISQFTNNRYSGAFGPAQPNLAYFRPQSRYSSYSTNSFKPLDLCYRCGKRGHWANYLDLDLDLDLLK